MASVVNPNAGLRAYQTPNQVAFESSGRCWIMSYNRYDATPREEFWYSDPG